MLSRNIALGLREISNTHNLSTSARLELCNLLMKAYGEGLDFRPNQLRRPDMTVDELIVLIGADND
jgi:hypothetical protein